MSNALFNALGGQNPIVSAFTNFMSQMKGQNPQQILNGLIQSGKISQSQLNQAQAKANEVSKMLDGIKGNFGF